MDSTQRTIILIKAQALQEAADEWRELQRQWADLGNELMADRYNFSAAMAAGRAAALNLSTDAE